MNYHEPLITCWDKIRVIHCPSTMRKCMMIGIIKSVITLRIRFYMIGLIPLKVILFTPLASAIQCKRFVWVAIKCLVIHILFNILGLVNMHKFHWSLRLFQIWTDLESKTSFKRINRCSKIFRRAEVCRNRNHRNRFNKNESLMKLIWPIKIINHLSKIWLCIRNCRKCQTVIIRNKQNPNLTKMTSCKTRINNGTSAI